MPWDDSDAKHSTKKANTPKKRRMWRKVANKVLHETGDDAKAKRIANAAVKNYAYRS